MRTIKWLQLLGLLLLLGGCSKNEPLTQEALDKELASKQAGFSEGIKEAHSGGEAPAIEMSTEPSTEGETPASESPAAAGTGVNADLKAPDSSAPASASKPGSRYTPLAEEPSEDSEQGIVVDPQRGDLGIRTSGMPEGYSVPYDRDTDK